MKCSEQNFDASVILSYKLYDVMEDFRNEAFHLVYGMYRRKAEILVASCITMIHHHKVLHPIYGILCCF